MIAISADVFPSAVHFRISRSRLLNFISGGMTISSSKRIREVKAICTSICSRSSISSWANGPSSTLVRETDRKPSA